VGDIWAGPAVFYVDLVNGLDLAQLIGGGAGS
jgi:hypothetical protein